MFGKIVIFSLDSLKYPATGMGSVRPEREFKVHPDQIKELRIGEAYIKRHTIKGVEVKKVWIRQLKSARK